ncbi:glycosyltransferase [Amycolatopsis sp. NPDC004378]
MVISPLDTVQDDPIATIRGHDPRRSASGSFREALTRLDPRIADLLAREYAGTSGAVPPVPGAAVATARRFVRAPLPRHPLAMLLTSWPAGADLISAEPARSVRTDLFDRSVATFGAAAAESALTSAFTQLDPEHHDFLFDTAARHRLVLPATTVGSLSGDGNRRRRHARWRYAATLPATASKPEGWERAWAAAAGGYERLLLSAVAARHAGPAGTDRRWPGPAPAPSAPGITVAQSMLLGSADRPGAGASGGLTVLLRSLADALTAVPGIGRVVTVVLCPESRLGRLQSLVTTMSDGDREHLVVHVPVDSPGPVSQRDLSAHRLAITFWIETLLTTAAIAPDVVHVRYSDDGSVAVSDAATRLGVPTVFTLTGDPHRALAARYRAGSDPDLAAAHQDLHRLYAADLLVAAADTVVALPRGGHDIERFFPALPAKPETVEEGISRYWPEREPAENLRQVFETLFDEDSELPRLAEAARTMPVMLSVGRLNPVKNQQLLVRTWIDRKLYRSYALVLVGGDTENPTAEERVVLAEIQQAATAVPEAAGLLAVVPAVSNAWVRSLEHGLAASWETDSPHLYVCPSQKEEFGIALLEAMEAGFLVCAPQRGGAGYYIRDEANGFLADTNDPDAFADRLADIVRGAVADPGKGKAIAEAGRQTVIRQFDINDVAAKFADVYFRTIEEGR